MIKKVISVIVLVAFVAMTTAAFAADVYVTKNGKKYHTETCPLIKGKKVTAVSEAQAIKEGRVPCSKCHKSEAVPIEKKK